MKLRALSSRLILGLVFGLTPLVASAATPAPVRTSSFWDGFSFGLVVGYMDYKEPGLMREYGKLYGINAAYYTLNNAGTVAWNFEGSLVGGTILYDGADVNLSTGAVTPKTAPTADYVFDLRATAGLYRELGASTSFTPYIGLGYRVLNDKIEGSGSYNRNVSYIYVPIGLEFATWMSQTWSFIISADIDPVLVGTVISKFSDLDPNAPDITNHNKGFGYRVTTSLRHDFGRFSGHITPFYQKWKMDKSDVSSLRVTSGGVTQTLGLFEPPNENDFLGLNIGVDY